MRVDRHNACPACPEPVRRLYYAATRFLDSVEDRGLADALVDAAVDELEAAAKAFTSCVDAHHANQDHALSPELASAREPGCRCR